MRHAAFAALALFGLAPMLSDAQIVSSGAHAPNVISTANGLPQVNVTRPSGAGVSLNTYSQFDVSRSGAILNNSPILTNTQLAGQITGNPNFGANDAAKIIVNQVSSNNPSQLRGYVEVAGQRTAAVVIANPSGLVVDGGGFINTSRGILTTGNPLIDASGNLTGFNVTQGNITVQGDGFNASNLDQADLIARAVQVNAAIYGNTLNAVTGANNVDYSSLNATPVAGSGAPSGVSIDVSELGGMYANRITLVGTENGVGVANAGTIAAQAGDLTLTTSGQLVQSGTLTASGNVALGAGSMANSGTIHAQQATTVDAAGMLANSGTVAAQQDTSINAGSVASTGLLGAGINADSTVGGTGNLSVTAAGQLSATGQNVAAGSVTLDGLSLDLRNAQTSAGTALNLTASGGNLGLAGATASAGSGLSAKAAGTLDMSGAKLGSGADMQLAGAQITNADGQAVSGGALGVQTTGALDNRQGLLQAAGQGSVSAGSMDNTGGKLLSLNGDGLTVSATGALTNGAGGVIGGNGGVSLTADALTNAGQVSAVDGLALGAQTLRNDGGTLMAGGTLTARAGAALSNVAGQLSGASVKVSGASIDNASGQIDAASGLTIATQGDVANAGGSVQGGHVAIRAGGTVQNAGGVIAASGGDSTLAVTGSGIDNSSGTLTNAGTGQTTLSATSGITNTGGVMGGNGDVTVNTPVLANDAGAQLVAGGAAMLNVTDRLDNSAGLLYGGTGLGVNQPGATLINDNGQINGGQDVSLAVASMSSAGGAVNANQDISVSGTLSGAGAMTAGHDLALAAQGDFANEGNGVLHADHDLTLGVTGTFTNAGSLEAGHALTVGAADVVNAAGAGMNAEVTTVSATSGLVNAGVIEGDSVTTNSATLDNTGALTGNRVIINAGAATNTGAQAVIAGADFVGIYTPASITNADGALIYSGGNMELARSSARDATGLLADQTDTIINRAATIQAAGDVDVAAHRLTNERTGVVTAAGTPVTTTGKTLTLWTAGIPVAYSSQFMAPGLNATDLGVNVDLGHYLSSVYRQWDLTAGGTGTQSVQGLAVPLTVTLPAAQVTAIDTEARTFSLTTPLSDTYKPDLWQPGDWMTRTITNSPTQYYNSLTENANGTVTITFWPDFDPATQIRPDQVQLRYDLGPDSHDYVEMSRTATTTTTTDQLLDSGTPALMQAQGAMRINADGGTIDNNSSTMTAGGDLVRRATGGSVDDTGTLLQQGVTEQDTSVFYWHQKTGGSNDTRTVVGDVVPLETTTVASLPAIATSGQTLQGDARTITIGSVNRLGETVTGAGVAGGDATGTQPGGDRHVQTAGSAGVAIPGLVLPANALYSYNTAPDAPYLIETDPRFTSYTKFISSDYMLDALGLNPQSVARRVGDGLYEQQLVMQQVTQLTGRTFLGAYTANLDEYAALMDNGVRYAQAFDLSVGVGLSAGQMAALTTDMVWLVSQTVTLPDGTQQTVLVPQLYLAPSSTVDLQDSGALVAGRKVSLNGTDQVTNSGHVAGDVATTVTGNNVVNRGVTGSGGTTTVTAVQDVTNIGGRIGGVDTVVTAGHDIINQSTVMQASATTGDAGFTSSATGMAIQSVGTISASNTAVLGAGRDVTLNGAAIQTGGDATIAAGRDINAGTTVLTATQDVGTTDGLNGAHATATHNVGSAITTGGSLTTVSAGNTTLTGATVQTGSDATMVAGGNLTATAAMDTASYDGQSMGGGLSHHRDSTYDETAQGSSINAGGNATLAAGQLQDGAGNLSILGSSVTTGGANGATGGNVNLLSTGDITIGAVTQAHDAEHWSESKHSGFLSGSKTTDSSTSRQAVSVGSTVSGESVNASALHDLSIAGSTLASTNDMALAAGHDLTITTTQDTIEGSTFHEEQKWGFGALSGGGASLNVGSSDQKTATHNSSVTNNGSLAGSVNGNVTMTAGNDLAITGSDVLAAQNVTGRAANVMINGATDTSHYDQTYEMKQSGFTLGLAGSVGDAVNGAVQQGQALASGNSDARATALHAIAAGGDAAIAVAGATGGALAGKNPSIGVQLSFGSSGSRSSFAEDQATQVGSNVMAGGKASFIATGDGTPGSGNVTIAGSNVSATDTVLAATNQVNLVNTTDTGSTRSSNSSSGVSVGVTLTNQGAGISASMQNAHGDGNSDAATQNATHVTGTNTVTIISGGDTSIVGSTVTAGKFIGDIGGDLNLVSVQDTTASAAHQSSAGGGISISAAGGSASVSAQNGHGDATYAQVGEQAGINAGDGGFDITVKGNTNLTGAVISSTADESLNSLSTGTLTFSDIQNQSHYSATSAGVSMGVGVASTGKATGPGSVSNTGGIVPMIVQNENGDQSATTRSAVSAGTITVTNQAAQTQDVANLSRDTTNTNGMVSKTPDVNAILNQQADTMQAAQAAGQVVAQGIGAYADMKRDQALNTAQTAYDRGDLDAANAALADYSNWTEGGDSRALMQAAGGALVGGLGGGGLGAVGGAAGAGLSSKLADQTKGVRDAVSDATGSSLLGNITANIVSGLGGALVGGSAGAAGAANVNLYNAGHDKNDTEAKKEAQELKQALDKERAMLGQGGAKVPPGVQAATVPSTALAAGAAAGAPKVPPNLQSFTNPAQSPVIPSDWISRPGRVAGSTIYYPPGTDPSAPGATYIRVMPPDTTSVPGLENGYWVSMQNGQPMNPATGGTGTRGQTHIPLPPNGMPPAK